jgi:gluconolactonase
MKHLLVLLLLTSMLSGCGNKNSETTETASSEPQSLATVERIDPALDLLINADAKAEILAEGFEWSEGPLWLEDQQALIFSDVPANIIYKWTEEKGKETYLSPSGRTGSMPYGGEPGSNGLTLNGQGQLVLCQHGDRRVAVMDAPLNAPAPKFISLIDNFQGKMLNSPNDVVFAANGDMFLTDPPYGLPKNVDDSTKELPFQGVFKVSNGDTKLITDTLTRPNGIALFPGEKKLIVANSDPEKSIWYTYDLGDDHTVSNATIFYDASKEAMTEKGLPDGLKIDSKGNVFATGPGGVWIFDQQGKVLGKIKFTELTSNCALSPDEKTLYVTADSYVVRIKLRD